MMYILANGQFWKPLESKSLHKLCSVGMFDGNRARMFGGLQKEYATARKKESMVEEEMRRKGEGGIQECRRDHEGMRRGRDRREACRAFAPTCAPILSFCLPVALAYLQQTTLHASCLLLFPQLLNDITSYHSIISSFSNQNLCNSCAPSKIGRVSKVNASQKGIDTSSEIARS